MVGSSENLRRRSEGGARAPLAFFLVALMLTALVPATPAEAAETSINLVLPDGGETIPSGSQMPVRWHVSSSGGYINVFLSSNGGRSYEKLNTIPNKPAHGIGTYEWFAPPNMNESHCRLKVQWVDSTVKPITVYAEDESEADFAIQPGVAISFRDVPTEWSYSRYKLVTYDLYDPYRMVDHVRFTWRVNHGAWQSLGAFYDEVDPAQGWIWWYPDYYRDAVGEIHMEAIGEDGSTVLSEDHSHEFTIISPNIVLVKPNGGVTMIGGSTYTIEWKTSADPEFVITAIDVRYRVSDSDIWHGIANVANTGEYDWTVPSGVNHDQVRVQVIAQKGEWQGFADDYSDGYNFIRSSNKAPSVTLVDPNPIVDGGVWMNSEETYSIRWTTTASMNIASVSVSYSTNNGVSWTSLGTAPSKTGPYAWSVPKVDTHEGLVRLQMRASLGTDMTVVSNNAFWIFDSERVNRPPVANAGPDQGAMEGEMVNLDGSTSADMDHDPLTYTWTQVDASGVTVSLSNPNVATPWFRIDTVHHYAIHIILELRVDDGFDHSDFDPDAMFDTDRVEITVDPRPPVLTSFFPNVGWEGTWLRIEGTDLMGAEILLGSTLIGNVPTSPVDRSPNPDVRYHIQLPSGIPVGEHLVAVRTMAGTHSLPDTMEIFPVPQWQYDNGLGFNNPSRERLNYPWNPFGETGRYRDVFGNQIYLSLWVCIGIPYWTPWDGWDCLGYLIEEPFCPDPLAAILYPIAFMNLADNGECFGMSMNALRFYHGDQSISEFDPPAGATTPGDLTDEWGTIRRTVDWRQGSQLASEVINKLLITLINGLVPSSSVTGMGVWIEMVKSYIDSGELGIASMICGEGAHAVVPYAYEETSSEIRFYVYDPNREAFSSLEEAQKAANMTAVHDDNFDVNNHPPYIRIEKSGVYWSWEFDWPDGSLWTSDVGLAYIPYNTLNGDRTIPTSVEGILHMLSGSAVGTVEDGSGGEVGVAENGSIMMDGIEGATPLPSFSGKGDLPNSWFLPMGEEYTAHIAGEADGDYMWGMLNNGSSGLCLDGSISEGAYDDVKVDFEGGLPLAAEFEYSTDDDDKDYTGSVVHKYGERSRNFTVRTTITDTGPHTVGTNDDYSGLVFTNGGTEPCTITVEFSTNVVSDDVWNGTSPPVSPDLPFASRSGIVVGPGETVEVYPTDWLDLDNAVVLLVGEDVPGTPEELAAQEGEGVVTLTWQPPADDGGLAISEYTVLRGDADDDLTALAVVDVAEYGTTFVDDTVERDHTYHYAVMARNLAGYGVACEAVSVDVPPLTAPGSPADLNVTEEEGVVTLTWQPPADDGGSPVTGYIVLRGTEPGNMAQLADLGLVTEYEDVDVEAGETYYYQVRAVNNIGDGPESSQATVDVPKEEEPGDDGTPWLMYVAVIVIIVILVAVAMMMRGKRGGPEASAPMMPETESEAEKTTQAPAMMK